MQAFRVWCFFFFFLNYIYMVWFRVWVLEICCFCFLMVWVFRFCVMTWFSGMVEFLKILVNGQMVVL